jgi:hypothetical protein
MAQYIDNISDRLDCNLLLETISSTSGDRRTFDPNFFDIADPKFGTIGDLWNRAGYDVNSIEWFNYYSGKDFPEQYSLDFGNLFNADPIKVWISKIRPGRCFPRHWDADYKEDQYKGKQLVRYQMFLKDYEFGHIFILEDTPILAHKQGDVWRWRNHLVWHGGANIGFKPKYIFNFLGAQR